MHVIAFTSRKGGSGKSTLCAHLSVYADAPDAPALLIDCDPQGSLSLWHELRRAATPVLAQCEARELADTVEAARQDGISWVMIDTPPHNTADIAAALRVADLAVIPFRPAVFDIAAVAATLDMARAIGKPVLPVINAAPPRRGTQAGHVVTEAREALLAMGAHPGSARLPAGQPSPMRWPADRQWGNSNRGAPLPPRSRSFGRRPVAHAASRRDGHDEQKAELCQSGDTLDPEAGRDASGGCSESVGATAENGRCSGKSASLQEKGPKPSAGRASRYSCAGSPRGLEGLEANRPRR